MLRAAVTSAIAYWERARIVYNLVLAVVVVLPFAAAWQLSGFRARWLKGRGLLLVVGIAFAAILTRYVSIGLLSGL